MTREELVNEAMRAFKGSKIDVDSDGLAWLRTPMTKTIDVIDPIIRADEKARLLQAARTLGKYVNADGLVPIGIVLILLGEKADA